MPQSPLSHIALHRAMLIAMVVLAITAGYFHSKWDGEKRKYQLLEDRYVRVRDQLGREEMQRLIDLSHQQ